MRWLGIAFLAAVAIAPASIAAPSLGPGCAPDRPAFAHPPGGAALSPQPPSVAIPCGVLTGFGGAEARVAVTHDGTLVFDPAVQEAGPTDCVGRCLHAGLAMTKDAGATWTFTESPTGSRVDNFIYADPDVNRVFWIPFSVASPTLEVRRSDNDGATWQSTTACCGSAENPHVVTAVPRTSTTTGFPKVVYLCSNTSYLGGLEPAAGSRVCSKSLDGGATFTLAGPLFSKPVPQHSECLPKGEVFAAVDEHYPQAAPDGSLYVLVRCGGAAAASSDTEYLAKSTDEGATWPIVHPIPMPDESANDLDQLRVDTAGNLYLFRTDPTTFRPLMRISTDGGATWSGELDIAAPSVEVGHPASEAEGVFTSPTLWAVAVREPGHVAVGYYARPPGQQRWDGYLTQTHDALAASPRLWSARLNPDDVDLTDAMTEAIGNDYIGTTIAPDGTPWAGFYHSVGFVGRLVPTPSAIHVDPVLPPTGGTRTMAVIGAALAALWCFSRRRRRPTPVRA
jgi:hypothetical protein